MTVRISLILLLLAHFRAHGQPVTSDATSTDRVIALQHSLTSHPALPGRLDARKELKRILASPEFAETMQGPSAWERWNRQTVEWVLKRFGALLNSIAQHPTTSQAIFWAAALCSLAVIAIALSRLFRRRDMLSIEAPNGEVDRTHAAAGWLREARAAAERDDFNRAIQCAYWAGVIYLQSAGSLPKSTILTPRELLAALRTANARENLRALTSSLERFWYAGTPAAPEDFTASLRQVEGLGCKVE